MRVDPKALVRRLTPTATRALEAAVGKAASGQFYEVTPEHLLAALLAPNDGDAARLLAHFDKNRSNLLTRVERSLDKLRAGNSGRPVISRALFTWIQDAWLVASVERGTSLVRSGDLLACFAENSDRYSAESFAELEELPHAAVRGSLLDAVRGSSEDSEALAGTVAGSSQATGATATSAAGAGNAALARFTLSLTQQARDGKIDPVLGRHREIRQMIDILSRRRKNNPILVGEPGVGKTALVEGLALAIVANEVPEPDRWIRAKAMRVAAVADGVDSAGATFAAIFKPDLRRRTIVGVLIASSMMIGAYGAGLLIPIWVNQLVGPGQRLAAIQATSACYMLINVGAVLGYLTLIWLTNAVGRRWSYFLIVVGCACSNVVMFTQIHTLAALEWYMVVYGFFTVGGFGTFAAYLPELFPTRFRATGQGFCWNMARTLTAVGPFAAGSLMSTFGSISSAGLTIAWIYVVGMVAIWFGPETRGVPLAD